jgi:DEAD/DEAH box helicase domain-containing protein
MPANASWLQFHAFDCEKRGSDDPENIIDCLYLYREFASEALRILVPYTRSGVDEASVQSFMAAMRIGLRKRFGGKVDHLRMVTQEEKGQDGAANRQYVLLYDSVPGGTGYLHELLANEAQTLVELLRLALAHLSACSCNADAEKDGCYRCVYQYRWGVRWRWFHAIGRDCCSSSWSKTSGSWSALPRLPTFTSIPI